MTIARMRAARERRGAMMTSWPNGWGWNDPAAIPPPGLFTQQRAGVPVTPHTVLQIGVVHRCLDVITNPIIKMGDPLAYKLALDKDNRAYRVYLPKQPSILTNTWAGKTSQSHGTTQTIVSMGLFGEAFWYTLDRDFYGFPTALEVLNPMFVTVNQDEDTGAPLYFYGTGLNRRPLDAENVTHIQGLTMPGARRALSTIEYESISFALALAALDFGSRWFAQGASPSFLLSTDQRVGPDEIKRIAEKFFVEHSGLQSAHLPLVVDSGLKVEKLGATPDEAEFIGTLEYARQEIAGYFGIPPHLVGSTGDQGGVWGKGIEEANYSLDDFTLSGYTVRINEAYSSLLPRGQYAALDSETLQRANAADRAKEIIALRTATIVTPNEGRRKVGLPPVEGGDSLDTPLASNTAPQPPAWPGTAMTTEAGAADAGAADDDETGE